MRITIKKRTLWITAAIIAAAVVMALMIWGGVYLLTKNAVRNSGADAIAKAKTAVLHTNMGDITIELASDMPITAGNFEKLVNSGFYDGTRFHRVIKNFMIQGGDPLSKDLAKQDSWGTGGPGYKIKDEFTSTNANNRGTIAMANSGPNTGGSQFFINLVNNNYLDSKHPVFGKVVKGMDIVDKIGNVATGSNDRPVQDVIITKAEII